MDKVRTVGEIWDDVVAEAEEYRMVPSEAHKGLFARANDPEALHEVDLDNTPIYDSLIVQFPEDLES